MSERAIGVDDLDTQAPRKAGPLPPYRIISDVFEAPFVSLLLKHAEENEAQFGRTTLAKGDVDTSIRVSVGYRKFGALRRPIEDKIHALLPSLIADLRMSAFTPSQIELEMVAHGDGAFYKRHLDISTDNSGEDATQRVLSAVYYFHTRPKAFSGGALRLHAFGVTQGEEKFVDLEPAYNTLIAFPSWSPHAVMPIHLLSNKFMGSRFAINCWVRVPRKPPAATTVEASTNKG